MDNQTQDTPLTTTTTEKGKKKKKKKIRDRVRILEAATAKAWSHMNLQIQKLMFSGCEFASPSAELNRVCNTSPLKL